MTRRVAVTLSNGRSHVLRLPEDVAAEQAAEVLCGLLRGSDIGWPEGDRAVVPTDGGQGWVLRAHVAEFALVEFADEQAQSGIYGEV